MSATTSTTNTANTANTMNTTNTQTSDSSQTPPEEKILKVINALRLGTWSLFTLVVAALLVVPVLGPYALGNPAVAGDAPTVFGVLLGSLFVGVVVAVVAEIVLY